MTVKYLCIITVLQLPENRCFFIFSDLKGYADAMRGNPPD